MNQYSRKHFWSTPIDATRGIFATLRGGRNFRIESIAAIVTVIFGFVLGISKTEWFIVLAMIAIVLGLDLVNHALERLTDRLSPEFDPAIGTVKDIAAGAVFLTAIFALIVGIMIFWPKLLLFTGLA